jgi:hypothetical protein
MIISSFHHFIISTAREKWAKVGFVLSFESLRNAAFADPKTI